MAMLSIQRVFIAISIGLVAGLILVVAVGVGLG
jgi:hypothetical protein